MHLLCPVFGFVFAGEEARGGEGGRLQVFFAGFERQVVSFVPFHVNIISS